MIQTALLARLRECCAADERLVAALIYGSFASGEADAHSDIELWLFFARERWAEIDPPAWCAQVARLDLVVRNEFGSHVVVFPGLVRGELHFTTDDDLAAVARWPARGAPIDRMIVVDRTGALARVLARLPEQPVVPDTADEVNVLCGRFASWLVLAHHVAARGEALRAWDALAHVQRHLTWMMRLLEQQTDHWLTPSRCAERELSATALAALRRATCVAEPTALRSALSAAWDEGSRCWILLAARFERQVPRELFAQLDAALTG